MSERDELAGRKAQLSEAKRALLLQRLRGQKAKGEEEKAERIAARPLAGALPLSYTQQRVWFLQQLYPDSTAYNMHEAWRVSGPLDLRALRNAFNAVIARHAALRTRFVTADNDEPRQIVEPALAAEIPEFDLTALSAAARESELQALARAEGNRPFDLGRAPLVRLSVAHLGADDYALFLTFHHIITDEWSNDVFWRDLNAAYGGRTLAGLDLQYPDFAAWQREQVATGALDAQLAYWQEQLRGELPLLQLPFDRPRPTTQSLRGGVVRRRADAGLLEALQELGQRHGATLYMTLLAAFQVLLHRTSAQEDILAGTPIANRQRPETAPLMGMFINTAVIRADFSGNPSFAALLAQIRERALGALSQQDLPFDVLVQALHPERDLSHNPLFQAMFVYNAGDAARALPGLVLARIPVDRGVAKFDLTLLAGEEDGRLFSALEYSADLFDRATAVRLLDHWDTLLHAVAADPQTSVSILPLLSRAEKEKLLIAWNDTARSLGDPLPLHQLIAARAQEMPDHTAVVSGAGRLSYGALDMQANRLAHRLRQYGLAPGTPVGLYAQRSPEMLVGILGILKAGGAYVPLEPAYPAERIAFAVQDTGMRLIVTQAALAKQLPPSAATVVVLDEVAAGAEWAATEADTTVGLDDLAYIIYTSGTTGAPKGVMVTHANLRASTLARGFTYPGPVGRYLLLSSFAFDSSVAGIFWTLTTGGTLVLPDPDQEKDVLSLAALIQSQQVTHTLALPSLYQLLLAYAPVGTLGTLQIVIVAGEACPPDLGERHGRALPGARLFNEYGPTEATVWCSVYEVPPVAHSGPVPIGRPIANYRLYILDAQRQPQPIGVPGELYVGGAGVTPGYWHNPDLTSARFPDLQIAGYPTSERVYRTGDLARWRADGEIEFLGRVDNQVKIRGYRIEPGEIEALLQGQPAVDEAAVIVWEAPGTGAAEKSLVAYVSGPRARDTAVLRRYLAQQLPDYMLPRQIIHLPVLPRTPNGKLDRRGLPAPDTQQDKGRPYMPPRTPAEETLARIWGDILHLPRVSIEDRFFELGGDSLMSIQVIARARQQGLLLTPRQLFQEQTITRLAAVAAPAAPVTVAPIDAAGPVPLAPVQRWFFELDLAKPDQWNQAAWFACRTDLDPAHLDAALAALARLHPQLRSRFTAVDGAWQQVVQAEVVLPPAEKISLAHLDQQAQDAALLAEAERLHATLDLAQGALLRAALFDLGEARPSRLLLVAHHLVIDTVSWSIFSADLAQAYEQIAAGDTPDLAAPPATYSQWVRAGIALAQSGALEGDRVYWQQTVPTVAPLPQDFRSEEMNSEAAAATVSTSLPESETEQLLHGMHEAYHTRVEDVLLTALARAVGAWTGAEATLLTLERHGREEIDPRLDITRTVGWFTALFPLALQPGDRQDPGSNLRAIKEQLRGVPRNGVSYGLLRYHGAPAVRQALAAQPQPQILFNYFGQARRPAGGIGLLQPLVASIGQAYAPANRRAHLLDVNARVEDGQLVVRWQFPRPYYRAETMRALAESYQEELRLLIAHCLEVEHGRYTPSDFPLAGLAQDDLDDLSDLLSQLD